MITLFYKGANAGELSVYFSGKIGANLFDDISNPAWKKQSRYEKIKITYVTIKGY
jgi:Fe-S cluster biosynthesis and repair protein YggX